MQLPLNPSRLYFHGFFLDSPLGVYAPSFPPFLRRDKIMNLFFLTNLSPVSCKWKTQKLFARYCSVRSGHQANSLLSLVNNLLVSRAAAGDFLPSAFNTTYPATPRQFLVGRAASGRGSRNRSRLWKITAPNQQGRESFWKGSPKWCFWWLAEYTKGKTAFVAQIRDLFSSCALQNLSPHRGPVLWVQSRWCSPKYSHPRCLGLVLAVSGALFASSCLEKSGSWQRGCSSGVLLGPPPAGAALFARQKRARFSCTHGLT